ncbi:MAG: hypothetical protein JW943_13220 [Deltaproteobacteria bacterium]|nr:hypothetical protein [Deltaproteobacteria bacterium]
MKETPDYEKYPISEEEMGKRYKNWVLSLATQMLIVYRVGKKVGGEEFIEELKEAYRNQGRKDAHMWMKACGSKPEDFKDCLGLPRLQDFIDDRFANFWDGYIENTPKAFEKELNTCPLTKLWSNEPDLCGVFLAENFKGVAEVLNPKFKPKGFSKLLTKGDKCCRYRIELEEE